MRVFWISPQWKKPEEAVGAKSLSLSPLLLMLIGRCHVSPNPQGNTYCLLIKWSILSLGLQAGGGGAEFASPVPACDMGNVLRRVGMECGETAGN